MPERDTTADDIVNYLRFGASEDMGKHIMIAPWMLIERMNGEKLAQWDWQSRVARGFAALERTDPLRHARLVKSRIAAEEIAKLPEAGRTASRRLKKAAKPYADWMENYPPPAGKAGLAALHFAVMHNSRTDEYLVTMRDTRDSQCSTGGKKQHIVEASIIEGNGCSQSEVLQQVHGRWLNNLLSLAGDLYNGGHAGPIDSGIGAPGRPARRDPEDMLRKLES